MAWPSTSSILLISRTCQRARRPTTHSSRCLAKAECRFTRVKSDRLQSSGSSKPTRFEKKLFCRFRGCVSRRPHVHHDCNDGFLQVNAVMENGIVAQNCGPSFVNASAIATANRTLPKGASPEELKLPFRSQRDAPQDLDLVSWPPRRRIPAVGKMPWYVYDVARGTDTYIYIIDNGINTNNPVRNPVLSTTSCLF